MKSKIATVVLLCMLFTTRSWADDPNQFNQVMGFSLAAASSDSSDTPGWQEILNREGSDGGQLTIRINTFYTRYDEIISFPQYGGATATAELEADDLIIVWDEDAGHGENENAKNFTFTGDYEKLESSEYADYLELTTTQPQTNWAVYKAVTAGTFTKGNDGTNEHEIIKIDVNLINFTKEDSLADTECASPE